MFITISIQYLSLISATQVKKNTSLLIKMDIPNEGKVRKMIQPAVITAVQTMQEYIDKHIHEKITLKQLSNACGYSPWHAARIFKEYTGKTPFDYIRALRLTKAALSLRDEKHKIIDVALDFMFDSHEGFTRAFSKEFGLSPKQYASSTPPIKLFLPEKVRFSYHQVNKGEVTMSKQCNQEQCRTEKSSNNNFIFVQIIERPARKFLLKRGIKANGYFEYCEEVSCDIWPILCSVKEALYEPCGMWLPPHLIKQGTSRYVQGVELPVNYNNAVPEGFDLIDLPPCKFMVFQGEPYDDDNFMEEVGAVMKAASEFNPNIYGYEWALDTDPGFQLAPMGCRGYIHARPVRKIR